VGDFSVASLKCKKAGLVRASSGEANRGSPQGDKPNISGLELQRNGVIIVAAIVIMKKPR
jgi:hypothetical protein